MPSPAPLGSPSPTAPVTFATGEFVREYAREPGGEERTSLYAGFLYAEGDRKGMGGGEGVVSTEYKREYMCVCVTRAHARASLSRLRNKGSPHMRRRSSYASPSLGPSPVP